MGRTVLPPVTMPDVAMFEVALGYARELIVLPGCADETTCFCEVAGRLVTLLRQTQNASAAEDFFETTRGRCP